MTDRLYQITLRNYTFGQAQALYRFMLQLPDDEPMHGDNGQSWSGLIASHNFGEPADRTITLDPMPTHRQITRERDAVALCDDLLDIIMASGVFKELDIEYTRRLARAHYARQLLDAKEEPE